MESFLKHWQRIAVTLLPLIFALLHAVGLARVDFIDRLDDIIFDARLRATSPRVLDDRIVIVDIDEKSLAEVGRWPWGRHRLAALVDELFERQKIALLGFDVVFAEADESSGLKTLDELAQNELRHQSEFKEELERLRSTLDYDARFAKSHENRPVVLGYYLTSDRDGRTSGVLPEPVMGKEALQGRPIGFTAWTGYGSNTAQLAKAAPVAGHFNPIVETDGVVRSLPLIVEFKGAFYESLSLAMFRMVAGSPTVSPGFPRDRFLNRNYQALDSIAVL